MNWVAPIKSEETLNRFRETLRAIDIKYYILFEIGVGTGMQLQDILLMRVKDIRGKQSITVKIGIHNVEREFPINKALQDRIGNFETIFHAPHVKWDYIRKCFLMPNGTSKQAVLSEMHEKYYANMLDYPFRLYLNWPITDEKESLFRNDMTFAKELYAWNKDEFTDVNSVTDISDESVDMINAFLQNAGKVCILVDCENANPYAFVNALNQFPDEILNKIDSVILYDDKNTTAVWQKLQHHTKIHLDYYNTTRVLKNKSLVDMHLIIGLCKKHLQDNIDSFIIVSSDSDYAPVIDELQNAKFLIMLQKSQSSSAFRVMLHDSNIFYCYVDLFYDGKTDAMEQTILKETILDKLMQGFHNNLKDTLNDALKEMYLSMTEEEKEKFLKQNFKLLNIKPDADWNLQIRTN